MRIGRLEITVSWRGRVNLGKLRKQYQRGEVSKINAIKLLREANPGMLLKTALEHVNTWRGPA